MTDSPRRRTRGNTPITADEAAARDFLKKFKNVMEADKRYAEYFLTNDKAITYYRVKELYKKEVLTKARTERELVKALNLMFTRGWVLSRSNLTEAFTYKVIGLKPIN